MKVLKTNEYIEERILRKKLIIAITSALIIAAVHICACIYIIYAEANELFIILAFSLLIYFFIYDIVKNPHGIQCYRASKLVIKKDRFIVYLEDGEVYQFPFSKIVRVGIGNVAHKTVEMELKKSKLNIAIEITRLKYGFCAGEGLSNLNKMVARRLEAALERYKNSREKICEKNKNNSRRY